MTIMAISTQKVAEGLFVFHMVEQTLSGHKLGRQMTRLHAHELSVALTGN